MTFIEYLQKSYFQAKTSAQIQSIVLLTMITGIGSLIIVLLLAIPENLLSTIIAFMLGVIMGVAMILAGSLFYLYGKYLVNK